MTANKRKYHRRSPQEQISDLQYQIAALKRQIEVEQEFSPEEVYQERVRLELSAADYGALVGVSMVTIYKWEKGTSRPRASQLEKWLTIKGIPKHEAWEELGYEVVGS